MLKRLLLILIGIVILAGLAPAEPPDANFLPFYWIQGRVSPLDQLEGRKVYLHGLSFAPDDVIQVEVQDMGNNIGFYKVNAAELPYWHADNVFQGQNDLPIFLLSIVRQNDTQWGAFEVVDPDFSQGWTNADLELKPDYGPKAGQGMVAAMVEKLVNGTLDPLENAIVTLTDYNNLQTAANGLVIWFDVNVGDRSVAAYKTGYQHAAQSQSPQDIAVQANYISKVDFIMEVSGQVQIVDSIDVVIEKVDTDGDTIDDSIKLTWEEPDNLPPGVTLAPLMLIGDGTGLYTNTLSVNNIVVYDQNNPGPFNYDQDKGKWLVMSDDADVATIINVDIDDSNVDTGEIILLGQVNGQGIPGKAYYSEFYIKLLLVQGDGMPDFDNPDFQASFANANCVGKLDLNIRGKNNYTLVSVPFEIQGDTTISNIIGTPPGFHKGAENVATLVMNFEKDPIDKNKDSFKQAMYLDANGAWQILTGAQAINYSSGDGFLIKSQAVDDDDCVVSVVGSVRNAEYTRPDQIRSGYNFISNPFPIKKELSLCDFSPSGAQSGAENTADQVFELKLLDENQPLAGTAFSLAEYLSGQDQWNVLTGASALTEVKAGYGYLYHKQSGAGFDWKYNPYQ